MESMSSTSVSERFQRIPSLQKECEAEYGKQASDAESLLKRLRSTRIEAERAAKEEIVRTRRLQVEEFMRHPEMVKWRQSLTDMEMKAKNWSRDVERKSQELRETIAGLERRLAGKQQELDRIQGQMNESRMNENRLRQQIGELETQLEQRKREQRNSFLNEDDLGHRIGSAYADHNKMLNELNQFKAQRDEIVKNWEDLQRQQSSLVASRDSLVREIEGYQSELGNWDRRLVEIGEQKNNAQNLSGEVQLMIQQHQARVSDILAERDQLGQKLSALTGQRQQAEKLYADVTGQINERENNINQIEKVLSPMENRYNEIVQEVERLKREAQMVQNQMEEHQGRLYQERVQLDNLRPAQQQAQIQVEQSVNIIRNLEQTYTNCLARVSEQEQIGKDFEARAKEAHDEIQKAKELEQTSLKGRQSAYDSFFSRHSRLPEIDKELGDIQSKLNRLIDPSYLDRQLKDKQAECDSLEDTYKRMLEDHRQAKGEREKFDHQVAELESKIRSLQAQIDEAYTRGPSSRFLRVQDELNGLQSQLDRASSELARIGGTNPFESELANLKSRSSEMEASIYSEWTTSNAPARLIVQLKREAEVVMRAEAALALERQQETVTRDTSKMTRYHISARPKFDLDEQAASTLLKEHSRESGPHEIASTVLEMCEQHHIYA